MRATEGDSVFCFSERAKVRADAFILIPLRVVMATAGSHKRKFEEASMVPCGDRWMTPAALDRAGGFAEKSMATGFGGVGVNVSRPVLIRIFQTEQLSNRSFGILFHNCRPTAGAGFGFPVM